MRLYPPRECLFWPWSSRIIARFVQPWPKRAIISSLRGLRSCFRPCFPAKPRRIASYVRFTVWFARRIACFVLNWPKRAILRAGSPPPGLHVVHAVGVKAKEGRMCCLGGPAPAAEATALWVLTLRGRSVRTAVGSRERRGLARDSVYALGSHIDSHARFAHHGLAWRRLHALRVRRRSGLLFFSHSCAICLAQHANRS